MLEVEFAIRKDEPLKILCLGAHGDDIEIGCGGTILKLAERYKEAMFYWVVLSGDRKRRLEAQKSAGDFLAGTKNPTIVVKGFMDGFFPFIGAEIKKYFETLKRAFSPNLVFTHYRNDLHQDHRLVSELTWNTFRDHLILEYEIPKYDGDLGCPNVYVHLEETVADRKIRTIINSFKSQAENQWFSMETFRSMMRLRGIESNAPGQYAEGFYGRKVVIV